MRTEWKTMMDWFRDDQNVEQWEDQMMAETGQTREEVRQTGGKMKRFYDLMEKDAKGTLTKDERTEFSTLQEDRELRRGLAVQEEIEGLQHSTKAELTDRNAAALDGSQSASANSFAASLADDTAQPTKMTSVEPLSPVYTQAANSKAVPSPIPAPILPPAQTIQINPDNMFG